MDEVLEQVTQFHEAQLKSAIKKLSAMIEPLTIVVRRRDRGLLFIRIFHAMVFAAGGF